MKNFLTPMIVLCAALSPTIVLAQPATQPGTYIPQEPGVYTPSTVRSVQPAWSFQIQNPLNVSTICGLIKKLLAAILALGLPVAMLFLVYAGFRFVVARGDPGKLKNARDNLLHVITGIALFLGAWFIGQVIANTINAVNPSGVTGINSCN